MIKNGTIHIKRFDSIGLGGDQDDIERQLQKWLHKIHNQKRIYTIINISFMESWSGNEIDAVVVYQI